MVDHATKATAHDFIKHLFKTPPTQDQSMKEKWHDQKDILGSHYGSKSLTDSFCATCIIHLPLSISRKIKDVSEESHTKKTKSCIHMKKTGGKE